MSTLKVDAIRHNSATSDAITTASDGTCTAKLTSVGGGGLSHRNLVINGAMLVAQRSTSDTGNGYTTVDRVTHYRANVNENPTFSQSDVAAGTTPYKLGFRKAFKITNGNQTGGIAATNQIQADYRFEAQDIANSGWDYTSSSSFITVSFWVKSSVAQDFKYHLRTTDGTNRNYHFNTGNLTANTWTKIIKTIPGDSNITMDNNSDKGMELMLFSQYGTNLTGSFTNNAWSNWSASERTQDQTLTWYATNDATYEITGVQLEVGDTATSFEHRSYAEELARCQRYYYRIDADSAGQGFGMGFQMTSSAAKILINLPVTMRAKPTAVETSGTASDYSVARTSTYEVCNAVPTFANATIYAVQVNTNQTQASISTGQSVLLRSHSANFFLGFSAELL